MQPITRILLPTWTILFLASVLLVAQPDVEARILNYLREHVHPGQPLIVTQLYNNVFTTPEEHQELNKLYNAFFRIPLFLAQYQEKFGKPPSLREIEQQFDLHAAGAADVLLRVMEADPRVPHFLTRDPRTGEVTHVDVAAIRADPQFGQAVEHQLAGWEGKPAPEFKLKSLEGNVVDSATLRGKVVLLYVWFTGCPPCMKEAPQLVRLDQQFAGRGLVMVGANADNLLGLNYTDADRLRYARKTGIHFPIVAWTKESDDAFGKISIFPTLFLIDRQGRILHHWVGFVSGQELSAAIAQAL